MKACKIYFCAMFSEKTKYYTALINLKENYPLHAVTEFANRKSVFTKFI